MLSTHSMLLMKAMEEGRLAVVPVPAITGAASIVPPQYALYANILGTWVRLASLTEQQYQEALREVA
jgi:hypothetical protein